MSYMDDIRGALAATSGASRRTQALHALGMSPDDTALVQGYLDDATSSLLEATAVLTRNGHKATGTDFVSASAGKDKGWRQTVYGGKKEAGTSSRVMGSPKKPRTYEEIFGAGQAVPEASTTELDVAHPWRTEERTK